MGKYALHRLLQGILSILVILALLFFLERATGDPARAFVKEDSSEEQIERLRHELGLDRPAVVQYGHYIWRVLHFDFGRTFSEDRSQVSDVVRSRIPATFSLAGITAVVVVLVAVPMGVFSALRRGTIIDTLGKTFAVAGQSIPQFWLGIMLIYIFAVWLGLLPVAQRGGPSHYVLPVFTAAWAGLAGVLRITRSSMLEVIGSDYVRTAYAKGLHPRTVTWTHAFRNALIPVITFIALLMGGMLNGFVLVEVVFAWPGLGQATVEAVTTRDFPLLQGLVVLIMVIYLSINFLVDMLYAVVDPRVRYES